MKILLLLTGGALGTLARYFVSGFTHRYFNSTFPLGTLMVNLIGSFIIGFIWALWENTSIGSNIRTFVFIGILGGFTTFSSYSIESLNLFRDGEIKLGLINIFANNFFALVLVFIGFFLAKGIIHLFNN